MKKLLTKSLLVAICLLGGVNFVWGETISSLGSNDQGWGDNKQSYTLASNKTLKLSFTISSTGGGDFDGHYVNITQSGDKIGIQPGGGFYYYGDAWWNEDHIIGSPYYLDNYKDVLPGSNVTITVRRFGTQIDYYVEILKGTTKLYRRLVTAENTFTENNDISIVLGADHAVLESITDVVLPSAIAIPSSFPLNTSDAVVPFSAGGIKTGTNVTAWSKNTNESTTANAYFASNDWTVGNQAYKLKENETVTVSFTAYEGWLNTALTATVKLLNSENVPIGEYTYNVNSNNVTDVKFNGTTPTGFAPFSGISKWSSNKNANGFTGNGKPFVTTANYNPTVTFTVSDNGYVTFTFVSANAGTKTFNATLPTSGDGAVAMDLASICVVDNITNSDRALGINNLSITSEIAAKGTVTFAYEDTNGNSLSSIKPNSSTQVTEGTDVASLITSALTSSFYNSDSSIRYDYADDYTVTGNATTVPASDITITLKFAPKEKYSYSANAVDGDDDIISADIITGAVYGSNTVTYYLPACVLEDGKLYFTESEAYYKSETVSSNNQQFPYKYNTKTVNNVIFFVEGEELSGANTSTPTSNQRLASKGHMGRGNDLPITTLPAGSYTIYLKYINTNSSAQSILIKAGEETVLSDNNVTVRPTKEANFTLTEATNLTVTAGGSSTSGIDYIYIVQTGVSATIGANGYTTFASQYPLDLSNLPEGLEAYTATRSGTTLSFAKCETAVPAGTGLLLSGTGGQTYYIPVAASAEPISGNALTGVIKAKNLKSDSENYIFAMKKAKGADDPLTFAPLSTTEIAFPIGKAYISVPASVFNSGSARALTVSFGDEATGIQELKNSRIEGLKTYYDLQGRRVAQPTKGLYMKDGRKVVIK